LKKAVDQLCQKPISYAQAKALLSKLSGHVFGREITVSAAEEGGIEELMPEENRRLRRRRIIFLCCMLCIQGAVLIAEKLSAPDPTAPKPRHFSLLEMIRLLGLLLPLLTAYGFGLLAATRGWCVLASLSLWMIAVAIRVIVAIVQGPAEGIGFWAISLVLGLAFYAFLGLVGGWLGQQRRAGQASDIGCGVLLVAGVALVAFGRDFGRLFAPTELQHPSVGVGKEFLDKSVFLTDQPLGNVTDIIRDPIPGAALGVAGLRGAAFLNPDNAVLSRVNFARATGKVAVFDLPLIPTHVQFVDLDGHGDWAFLNRGGGARSSASLYGKDGRTLWTYGGTPGVDDMTAGKLGRDHAASFVVGFDGDGGIRRLDKDAQVLWRQPDENVSHVEIVDAQGDGIGRIIHTGSGRQFTVRDANGAVMRQFGADIYCSHFSVCRWPDAKSSPKLLLARKGQVLLSDLVGKTVAEFKLPTSAKSPDEIHGTAVRLKSSEPEFLAVVVDYRLPHASVLSVLSHDQKLVYQEVIADDCCSILALPRKDSQLEDLLVGSTGTIWRYAAAQSKNQKPPHE
jgi:hypothetical protein